MDKVMIYMVQGALTLLPAFENEESLIVESLDVPPSEIASSQICRQ